MEGGASSYLQSKPKCTTVSTMMHWSDSSTTLLITGAASIWGGSSYPQPACLCDGTSARDHQWARPSAKVDMNQQSPGGRENKSFLQSSDTTGRRQRGQRPDRRPTEQSQNLQKEVGRCSRGSNHSETTMIPTRIMTVIPHCNAIWNDEK